MTEIHRKARTTVDALRHSGRIAVLMGGVSAEREVSLESGTAVVNALLEAGFNVASVDTGENCIEQILHMAPDFCFIALHGGDGENGHIQALLDLLTIPYSGSGVLGSALAMDKARSKQIWLAQGLSTPRFKLLDGSNMPDADKLLESLGGSVFVKPNCEGSSFGMGRANTVSELHAAIEQARRFQSEVLVEQCIDGPEYTVAVLKDQKLPAIAIQTDRAFYDFEAKYHDDDTLFSIPCGLSESEEQSLQTLARSAFDALGCEDWGRIDVMREASTGTFYLLEANTVPGLTSHSLVPMAARAAGKTFGELLTDVIALALEGCP